MIEILPLCFVEKVSVEYPRHANTAEKHQGHQGQKNSHLRIKLYSTSQYLMSGDFWQILISLFYDIRKRSH